MDDDMTCHCKEDTTDNALQSPELSKAEQQLFRDPDVVFISCTRKSSPDVTFAFNARTHDLLLIQEDSALNGPCVNERMVLSFTVSLPLANLAQVHKHTIRCAGCLWSIQHHTNIPSH